LHQLQTKIKQLLKPRTRRFHEHSSGWIEVFCPFCNDATRKHNPSHGHLYMVIESNYFNCFRCSEVGSVVKLLDKYNIHDQEVNRKLSSLRYSDISYSKVQIIATGVDMRQLHSKIMETYSKTDKGVFQTFYKYMTQRCFDIDIVKYLAKPTIQDGYTGCLFTNASNQFITTRLINHPTKRYSNADHKPMYYFQDIRTMIDSEQIVMCEGVFDIINLSNHYYDFKDSFYVAINGNQYAPAVRKLIYSYLMIGSYTVSIVFDTGLFREDQLIKQLLYTIQKLNPRITLKIYKPILSKDSSEFMCLNQIL